jgi:GNAT superfamily N-acetyltransferase
MAEVFSFRLWAAPDPHGSGSVRTLLGKAEKQACAIGREEGADSVTLFSQATSTQVEAQQALTQSGFSVLSIYEKMELALSEPPLSPETSPGIEIRPFACTEGAELVYRADEEAFMDQRNHTPRTFERWKQRLNFNEGTFDPSVWCIAWNKSEIAGAALGEVLQDTGWIHHLFVRRPWRRQGLGAALMLSILGSLHRHGVRTARLNVDADSLTNAHLLYRRLGFRAVGEYSNYEKTVSVT